MTRYSRDFYRSRAIRRQRDPEQDARNAEASALVKARVEAALEQSGLIQRLNAAAARLDAAESTPGTC